MFVRTLLASLFCFSSALLWAADPAAVPAGGKADKATAGTKSAEFAKINKEWTDLVANLGALKNEYATAPNSRKEEIRKQYNDGIEKAKATEGKLVAAAESAYAEAPNADPSITGLLVVTLAEAVKDENYEEAFRVGKILMEHKCTDKFVPALAGVAAYAVNEYDLAKPWLQAANSSGMLSKIGSDMQRQNYAHVPDTIDATEGAWVKEKKIREAEAKADDLPRVLMKTSVGDVEIELFENEAPNTVLNFITLVDKGYYNGLKFHRVLSGFMAQGGDPKGDGTGGPGYTIPDECNRPDHRLHFRGSLSMAHTSQPDTGGSQFFLMFMPWSSLDGAYTVFGRVVSGFDVLAKIKRRNPEETTVGPADTIIEAKVIRRRPHPYDVKDLKKSGAAG